MVILISGLSFAKSNIEELQFEHIPEFFIDVFYTPISTFTSLPE